MRKLLMEFPDFGAEIVITLEEKNKELCDDVWNALPFACVQEHGLVGGEMIYCWTPLVSLAPISYKLLHTESPVGCVSFTQGTGNKILIKYGACNEEMFAPVLGYIDETHHAALKTVGREVWFNYFHNKDIYTVSFRKLEEAVI